MHRVLAFAAAALVCAPLLATEPGQPLDCEDWVVAAPGLSVGPDLVPASFEVVLTDRVAVDNEGGRIVVGNCCETRPSPCDSAPLGYLSIRRVNHSGVVEVLACVPFRSGPVAGSIDQAEIALSGCFLEQNSSWTNSCVRFNPINGDLHFNYKRMGGGYPPGSGYPIATVSCVLRGLPTLYDVQQTFIPPSTIGYYVPAMPEGMPSADSFSTFYGPLTKPINFAQAQPLACDYPSTPPAVGDYLTVTDPLPDPALGTGRYYVTSATHNGVTRYGRKTAAGVLSGRDPAAFPSCELP
jgi:hypothetical protein